MRSWSAGAGNSPGDNAPDAQRDLRQAETINIVLGVFCDKGSRTQRTIRGRRCRLGTTRLQVAVTTMVITATVAISIMIAMTAAVATVMDMMAMAAMASTIMTMGAWSMSPVISGRK